MEDEEINDLDLEGNKQILAAVAGVLDPSKN